jgi:hypothetical protein
VRRHKLKMLQCNRVGVGRSHRSRVSHSCTSPRRTSFRRPGYRR